jgi:hypothetical protein
VGRVANLVVVMAGDRSFHEQYARGRDFELWVYHWGDDPDVADRYRRTCDRLISRKGEKWALVRDLRRITDGVGEPPFSKYDYVFLPDDDIAFPRGAADVSRAFQLAKEIGADVFQPSIGNDFYSHWWEATRRNPDFVCRATNVAEIMMPAFTSEILRVAVLPILHTFDHVRLGWGLEPMIVRMGEAVLGRPLRVFVLDAIAAIHTRPVGQGSASHSRGQDEGFMLPQSSASRMTELARFPEAAEAARFVFPFADEAVDRAALDHHLRGLHDGRMLASLAQERNV